MKWLRYTGIALACGLLLVVVAGYMRQRQYEAVEWTECGHKHPVPCIANRHGQQKFVLVPMPRHELHFIGNIGSGFDEAVGAALKRFPDVRTFAIAMSGGGLQAPALRAARQLDRHGVAVRIDGPCASACATLWASVRLRQADPTARIGLHDGRLVGKVPAFLRDRVARQGRRETAEALRAAGFPESEIERGSETPNANIYWLDVPAMQRIGVRFEVVGSDPIRRSGSNPPPAPRS